MNRILQNRIAQLLTEYRNEPVSILSVNPVGGGSINTAYQLRTNLGLFFVKTNSAVKFPAMFEQEAMGLKALAATNTLKIPKVIATSEKDEDAFLLLEWIGQGRPSPSFWEDFGRQLALLHKTANDSFGWPQDNYIGSLVQHNRWTNTWHKFFILQRLEPQLQLAKESGLINASHLKNFEKLFHRLEQLFPQEPPSLLHGDLWSGNYLVAENGAPVIMDPAVYYGHREMDIAMTQLFGGFDPELYHHYSATFPLEKGWKERVPLCNLYPLLVHVNLFGSGYVAQVESVLRRFT